ncbi:MAG: hypothetical protein HY611_01690, partial [Elusimicrobia bacterium]|nr:hypothetical protein [Elusimicrobiota bacterium]
MKARPGSKFLWLALFAAALPRPAGAAQTEASGYLKEFYRRGRSPLDHSPYWLSLTRARLTLENTSDLVFDSRLKLHLDYDHELRSGTFLKSPEFKTFGLGEPPGFWDLERTVSARGGRRYRHLLYRAWAGIDRGADQIRAGRQRIAWGTGKLWNPTDFINPYQPTAPERDERRGVDAFSWRHGFGDLSQGTLVYTFAGNWSETDLLGRFRSNARGVDMSLMGGKVSAASSGVAASASSWMAGGDFSVDMLDGNLHGEATYTDLRRRSAYWKTLIGYEYMFPVNPPVGWLRDVWVLGEYY